MKIIFALAIVLSMVAFLAPVSPVLANECKNYEYTTPAGVTLLDQNEILAAVEGNTIHAFNGAYKLYLKPGGTLEVKDEAAAGRLSWGKWWVCGSVLILDTSMNGGEVRERIISKKSEGYFAFYVRSGANIGISEIKKGKSF